MRGMRRRSVSARRKGSVTRMLEDWWQAHKLEWVVSGILLLPGLMGFILWAAWQAIRRPKK